MVPCWHHGIPWIPWLWSHLARQVLESTCAFAKTTIGTPYYLSPEICNSDIWWPWDTGWYGLRGISWKLLGSCWEVVGVVTSTCQGFYMLLHCTVCKGMTEWPCEPQEDSPSSLCYTLLIGSLAQVPDVILTSEVWRNLIPSAVTFGQSSQTAVQLEQRVTTCAEHVTYVQLVATCGNLWQLVATRMSHLSHRLFLLLNYAKLICTKFVSIHSI